METLHTILLGPYKYLTRMVMGRLTRDQKVEVAARMTAISYSGIKGRVHGDITRYHGSFVGLDYKASAQIALFIIAPYLMEEETAVWLSLSKVYTQTHIKQFASTESMQVFQLAYCEFYEPTQKQTYQSICNKQAPSRDIANRFALMGHLQYLCSSTR